MPEKIIVVLPTVTFEIISFTLKPLLLCFTSPLCPLLSALFQQYKGLRFGLCNWSNSSTKEQIHSFTYPGGKHLLAIGQKYLGTGSTVAWAHEVLFHFCNWTFPESSLGMMEKTQTKPIQSSLSLPTCILKVYQYPREPWHSHKIEHTSAALRTAWSPAHGLSKSSTPLKWANSGVLVWSWAKLTQQHLQRQEAKAKVSAKFSQSSKAAF